MPGNFKEWYARNGQRYNAQRRRRYREDASYREKKQAASREYRRIVTTRGPKAHRQVTIGGVQLLALTIGQAADAVGVGTETLRRWERREYVPSAKRGGSHRRYTLENVELLVQLRDALNNGLRGKRLDPVLAEIQTRWR